MDKRCVDLFSLADDNGNLPVLKLNKGAGKKYTEHLHEKLCNSFVNPTVLPLKNKEHSAYYLLSPIKPQRLRAGILHPKKNRVGIFSVNVHFSVEHVSGETVLVRDRALFNVIRAVSPLVAR